MSSLISKLTTILLLSITIACGGGGSDDSDNQQSKASLATLKLSVGLINESIDVNRTNYSATLSHMTESVQIQASATVSGTVSVNGETVSASTSSMPITLEVGTNNISIQVASSDGSSPTNYSLTINRQDAGEFSQNVFMKSEDALELGEYGAFGASIATQDNLMVVGARANVYVYELVDNNWNLQATIQPSFGGHNASVIEAVAIDGNTLVAGDFRDSTDAAGINSEFSEIPISRAGAVYIFEKIDGEWIQQAYIKAEDRAELEEFGFAVALAGDTLVVGARGYELSGPENSSYTNHHQGSAYVYSKKDDEWSFDIKLTAPFPTGGDHFGEAVAIDENTIVIGSHLEDGDSQGQNGDQDTNIGPNSGAVYIYERNGGQWSLQTYLKSSDSKLADQFGYRLDLDGDILAVSAALKAEDSESTKSGGVYLFSKQAGWDEIAYLEPSVPLRVFGDCIAVSGDFVLVGASFDNGRGAGIDPPVFTGEEEEHSGSAFLFELQNGVYEQVAYMKPSNPQFEGHFGSECGLSDNFIVAGASFESTAGSGINPSQSIFEEVENSGALYIFPKN